MKKRWVAWTIALILFGSLRLPASVYSEKEKENRPKGFVDLNLYLYDNKDFTLATINTLAPLPADLTYFSLINFTNPVGDGDYWDADEYYTEQNIMWAFSKEIPVDFSVQAMLLSGKKNDALRLGLLWKANQTSFFDEILKKLHANYFIVFHILQLDHDGDFNWQIEHVYRVEVFSEWFDNRVYVMGYADHNLGGETDNIWVTDHQLGVRLVDHLYAVTEYRYHGFRKESSLGVGVEYVFNF